MRVSALDLSNRKIAVQFCEQAYRPLVLGEHAGLRIAFLLPAGERVFQRSRGRRAVLIWFDQSRRFDGLTPVPREDCL